MKKLLIYLDEERHEDLKRLALHHKTSMAELVRYAIEETFEDQLDVMAGERGMEEYLRDPSSARSLDEVMKELGIALPERNHKESRARTKARAG